MIDLWLVSVADREADWRTLAGDERARAARLLIDDKRIQFVATRAALRRILARKLGRDPAALRFSCNEHGKPSLVDAAGVDFNVSHSHQLALIAVADGAPVGVDVERLVGDCDFAEVARHHFAAAERQALATLPATAQSAYFWQVWTLKEAFLKARGTGLSFDSRQCSIGFAENGAPCLSTGEPAHEGAPRWHLHTVDADPGYTAAVCWAGPPQPWRNWRA